MKGGTAFVVAMATMLGGAGLHGGMPMPKERVENRNSPIGYGPRAEVPRGRHRKNSKRGHR